LLTASLCCAQGPSEKDRLIQTAKVWIAVKYFHPYLAYKSIDWDKALLDALPKIRAAGTPQDFAAALQSMLDVLHDPGTQAYVEPNELGTAFRKDIAGRRIWIHNGLPPESGENNSPFYSAFLSGTRTGSPASINLVLGPDVGVLMSVAEAVPQASEPIPSAKPDTYPEGRYPSTEYRILAAFKSWGIIHEFFSYRDLMDEDWDDVFASFLPRFIAAKDAREYNLTVADMLTHTLDSHVTVASDELTDYFGRATLGLRLRLIEKRPVITEILDENAKSAGVHVGDVVAKIDGEPTPDRFNHIQDYISGSTAQRRGYDSIRRVLDGPDGSTATLTVAGVDGVAKEVKLQRKAAFFGDHADQSKPDPIRTLPGNIGYVDLTRLSDPNAIFEKLLDTRGIIFDARGEVSPGAEQIASHLTIAPDTAGAIITGPITLAPDLPTVNSLTATASYFVVEKIPTQTPVYKGKTVMLIDERTIGEAEHAGLWMEAANNTAFVGTPSAGAYGAMSNFALPGGITVTFSGQDVRHGNSGKLQRLGLQPKVLVAPTLKGLRAGRDEVLEEAIKYLSPAEHTQRAAN
jgi:C-terminal processing protease CtpA/Prc